MTNILKQQAIIENNQELILRIDKLNEDAWIIKGNDPQTIYKYAKEALSLSAPINYTKGIAYSKMYLALAEYMINADVNVAMEYIYTSIDLFKEVDEPSGEGKAYSILGIFHSNMGNYDTAFEWILKGFDLNKNASDSDLAWSNYTLGTLYERLDDFSNAKHYLAVAESYFEKVDDYIGFVSATTTIGSIVAREGDYQASLVKHYSSLELAEKYELEAPKARSLYELGQVYMLIGNVQKAMDYTLQSLLIREKIQNKQGIVTSQHALGEIHYNTKDYDTALAFLERAKRNAEAIDARPKLLRILKLAAQVHKELGNFEEGFNFYEQYIELRNKTAGEETSAQLKNMKAMHAAEKARKESEYQRLVNGKLKDANKKIAAQQQNILKSIQYAKRIQTVMLPETKVIEKHLEDFFVFYEPRDIVSGDVYWFEQVNGKSIIAAIDCTGHGVPGALMSMIADTSMNKAVLAKGLFMPDEILKDVHSEINLLLKQQTTRNRDGMDMTICVIDHEANKLYFSGANNPLFYFEDGKLVELKGERCSIGGYRKDTVQYYQKYEVDLKGDKSFFMFSDGYQDQFGGEQNRKFMKKSFKKLLEEIHTLSAEEQKYKLEQTIMEWKGEYPQTDDIMVMGFKA